MGRSRPGEPEREDTGRLGYRHEWEEPDGRPLLLEHSCSCIGCRGHEGFWRDRTERLTYEAAVEASSRGPDEGPMAYARRISVAVVERYRTAPVQAMPPARMTRRERDARLGKLRRQAVPEWIEDQA